MKRLVFSFVLSVLGLNIVAQQEETGHPHRFRMCDESGYCIPALQGLPRPKGIEIDYARALDYGISTQFKDSANIYSDQLLRNRRFSAKIKMPVLMKPGLTLLLGAKYTIEEFRFENPNQLGSDIHAELEDKPLRSLGGQILAVKPFRGHDYMVARLNVRLSGDFSRDNMKNHVRSTAAILYGRRSSDTKTWAFGLAFNYTFGRQAVIPIFAFSKKISSKLSLESLLPVNVRLRYMVNEKSVFDLFTEVQGDKYYVGLGEAYSTSLFLEKSEVLVKMSFEREIHDFLWFRLSIGARRNIKFDLSESGSFLDNTVPEIQSSLESSFLYQVGIFMVPPRNWLK